MKVEVNIQDCTTPICPEDPTAQSQAETLASHSAVAPSQTVNLQLPDLQIWTNWFDCWMAVLADDPETISRLPVSPNPVYELTIRLTTDGDIQALNTQYRHQDRPTDVLAFATLDTPCSLPNATIPVDWPFYLGDIAISVETAQRQASQHQHDLPVELAWLAAHGFLHLLGWDHPDDASLHSMLQQQAVLLKSVGLTVTLESLLEPAR